MDLLPLNLAATKVLYAQEYAYVASVFAEWSEQDILSILEDTCGDVDLTVTRISEGHAQQWNTTKKKEKKKLSYEERTEFATRGRGLTRGVSRGTRGRGRGGLALPHTSHADMESHVVTTDTWATEGVQEDAWDMPKEKTEDWADQGTADSWNAPAALDSWQQEEPKVVKAAVPVKPVVKKQPPSSWAQLLKTPDVVEVVEEIVEVVTKPVLKSPVLLPIATLDARPMQVKKEYRQPGSPVKSQGGFSRQASPERIPSVLSSPIKEPVVLVAAPILAPAPVVHAPISAPPGLVKQAINVIRTPKEVPVQQQTSLDMRFGQLDIEDHHQSEHSNAYSYPDQSRQQYFDPRFSQDSKNGSSASALSQQQQQQLMQQQMMNQQMQYNQYYGQQQSYYPNYGYPPHQQQPQHYGGKNPYGAYPNQAAPAQTSATSPTMRSEAAPAQQQKNSYPPQQSYQQSAQQHYYEDQQRDAYKQNGAYPQTNYQNFAMPPNTNQAQKPAGQTAAATGQAGTSGARPLAGQRGAFDKYAPPQSQQAQGQQGQMNFMGYPPYAPYPMMQQQQFQGQPPQQSQYYPNARQAGAGQSGTQGQQQSTQQQQGHQGQYWGGEN